MNKNYNLLRFFMNIEMQLGAINFLQEKKN